MTSDKEVFTALCEATDLGKTLEGGYKEVWEELAFSSPWCHFRAAQLGRVGRKWETYYNNKFSVLCPGLKAVASDWNGRS